MTKGTVNREWEAFIPVSLICSRLPIPTRPGPEPLGEPTFEEVGGKGDTGTPDASSTHAMKQVGINKNGLQTLGQDKTRKARDAEKSYASSNRKWLEPEWRSNAGVVLTPIRWLAAILSTYRAAVTIFVLYSLL